MYTNNTSNRALTAGVDFVKVSRTIKSCTNTTHFTGVDNLIALFAWKHDDADLAIKLLMEREEKFNSIHSIIK